MGRPSLEAVAVAMLVAATVDMVEASAPEEGRTDRRRTAAIKSLAEGILEGQVVDDDFHRDIQRWVHNKLTMTQVVTNVIERLEGDDSSGE